MRLIYRGLVLCSLIMRLTMTRSYFVDAAASKSTSGTANHPRVQATRTRPPRYEVCQRKSRKLSRAFASDLNFDSEGRVRLRKTRQRRTNHHHLRVLATGLSHGIQIAPTALSQRSITDTRLPRRRRSERCAQQSETTPSKLPTFRSSSAWRCTQALSSRKSWWNS